MRIGGERSKLHWMFTMTFLHHSGFLLKPSFAGVSLLSSYRIFPILLFIIIIINISLFCISFLSLYFISYSARWKILEIIKHLTLSPPPLSPVSLTSILLCRSLFVAHSFIFSRKIIIFNVLHGEDLLAYYSHLQYTSSFWILCCCP